MGFKIALIGCGWMGQKGHGPSYVKYKMLHPDTVLSACCDVNREAVESFAKQFGFENVYTDYIEMLNTEKPDAVCLVASEHVSAKIAVNVLSMGYPLMLEKPPGVCTEETEEIIKAASKAGVMARVAFNRRYMPLIKILKDEIKNSDEIQYISYRFVRYGRKDTNFYTTCIHGIDLVKYLSGSEYETADINYKNIIDEPEYINNIFMDCEFKNGVCAQLAFMPMGGGVIERVDVTMKDRTYIAELPSWGAVDSPGRILKLVDKNVEEIMGEESEVYLSNGFYNENAEFFDAVKMGETASDVHTGLQSMSLAYALKNKIRHLEGEI